MILTEMRRSAEKALGHPVSKAVVTVFEPGVHLKKKSVIEWEEIETNLQSSPGGCLTKARIAPSLAPRRLASCLHLGGSGLLLVFLVVGVVCRLSLLSFIKFSCITLAI